MRRLVPMLILLLIAACTQKSKPEVMSDEEVKGAAVSFLSHIQGHNFKTVDQSLLTSELLGLVEKAKIRTQVEEKKVEGRSDKPFIIEGDIFSSIHEGWDTYEIIELKVEGSKASVIVEFKNTSVGKMMVWKDELVFEKEKTWKLDNVIFRLEDKEGSSKEQLRYFIEY